MKITIRDTQNRRACVDSLRAVERFATDGGHVDDMTRGCSLLDVLEDGRIVGAVAVRIEGSQATIMAATGNGVATYAELACIERMLAARGVRRVGLFTKRPGLVRQLIGQGYGIAECELFKELPDGLEKIQ